jgi:hypothetical protein
MYCRLWIEEGKPQTTQTRQRVALAYGELLPQPLWRCQKVLPIFFMRPQSGCGSSSRPKGAKATGLFVCGFYLMYLKPDNSFIYMEK